MTFVTASDMKFALRLRLVTWHRPRLIPNIVGFPNASYIICANSIKQIMSLAQESHNIQNEPRPGLSLVTQPMLQPNPTEFRSMDYYHQIFCRFRKCKRKVPPPSPLRNDF